MKRCIKWFNNWCYNRAIKMCKEEIIGISLGAITSLLVCVLLFVSLDKVPATPFDYEQMENQVIAIQQNHDLLFKTNCNIEINNEVITVNFENDECKLIVEFDQNFEILSTSKEDNCWFWLSALGASSLVGILTYFLGSFVWIVLIFLFAFLTV